MNDEKTLTQKEAISLILGFYTFTNGYWKEEVEQSPEVKNFVENGYAILSDEYPDLYILSQEGQDILHKYIRDISENLIKFLKREGLHILKNKVNQWFKEEFQLDSIEDAKDIAYYIEGNLYRYGFKVYDYRYDDKILAVECN